MPATSCSGDCLARRSARRAGGLAFEVEDDVVAAGAEELAEVVVAVDADALAGFGGRDFGDGAGRGRRARRGGRG